MVSETRPVYLVRRRRSVVKWGDVKLDLSTPEKVEALARDWVVCRECSIAHGGRCVGLLTRAVETIRKLCSAYIQAKAGEPDAVAEVKSLREQLVEAREKQTQAETLAAAWKARGGAWTQARRDAQRDRMLGNSWGKQKGAGDGGGKPSSKLGGPARGLD